MAADPPGVSVVELDPSPPGSTNSLEGPAVKVESPTVATRDVVVIGVAIDMGVSVDALNVAAGIVVSEPESE